MTPRRGSGKLGSASFIAAVAFSLGLGLCAATPGAQAGETALPEAGSEFLPGSDRATTRPPATFFTINEILAKLDRERGHGPSATRLAALTPSNIATDSQPEPKAAPAVGTEPFGLFTFRAPEGILWRKWRGLESDLARDEIVLEG